MFGQRINKIIIISFIFSAVVMAALFFGGRMDKKEGAEKVFNLDMQKAVAEKHILMARIGGASLKLEVADTAESQFQGLSGREGLKFDEGMIFIFDEPWRAGFWMKDMRFPIDIIWFDSEKNIIDFKKEVSPDTFPEIFYPDTNASYVVEVQSGFLEKNAVKIGDKLVF